MAGERRKYFKYIIGIVLLLAILGSILSIRPVLGNFVAALEWVRDLDFVHGAIALALTNILAALLFLPCLPFTLGAGFLYGCLRGTFVVHLATTLAAVVSFLFARYLARATVENKLGNEGRFRVIDAAIAERGFRIVFLIRASPLHPYGVMNYVFGLTSVSLRDYTLASFIAMLPGTAMEVYLGTTIKNFSALVAGEVEQGQAQRVFFWGGLIITILLTIYITVWLKRELAAELQKFEKQPLADIELSIFDTEQPFLLTDIEIQAEERAEQSVEQIEQQLTEQQLTEQQLTKQLTKQLTEQLTEQQLMERL